MLPRAINRAGQRRTVIEPEFVVAASEQVDGLGTVHDERIIHTAADHVLDIRVAMRGGIPQTIGYGNTTQRDRDTCGDT